jgi:hypothetical protein
MTKVRACLDKNGLPTASTTGKGRQRSVPPKHLTHTEQNAIIERCGLHMARSRSQAVKRAAKRTYSRFEVCMAKHGVHLPEPNTSGSGPVYNAPNASSAKFRPAEFACRYSLPPTRATKEAVRSAEAASEPSEPPTG